MATVLGEWQDHTTEQQERVERETARYHCVLVADGREKFQEFGAEISHQSDLNWPTAIKEMLQNYIHSVSFGTDHHFSFSRAMKAPQRHEKIVSAYTSIIFYFVLSHSEKPAIMQWNMNHESRILYLQSSIKDQSVFSEATSVVLANIF